MKKLLVVTALTSAALVLSTAAHADSWKRNRTVVGPYGGVHTLHGSGSCSGSSCSSSQKWTGPAGNSVSRNGSHSCSGSQCSGGATWNGPARGGSVKRSWQRY